MGRFPRRAAGPAREAAKPPGCRAFVSRSAGPGGSRGPAGKAQANEPEPGGEEGSAIIEFIFLVVLLLVPLVYLVIGAAALQSAAYAAVGAADHGAKVFVTAESEGQAGARVADAVRRAASNMGIDGSRATFSYSCNGACLSPGSTVTVRVSIDTVLPLLPQDWAVRTGVVSSSTTHRVDRYG